MPNTYGIPEDTTDATLRAGHLAPTVNAIGAAVGDVRTRTDAAKTRADDAWSKADNAQSVNTTQGNDIANHEGRIVVLEGTVKQKGDRGATLKYYDTTNETLSSVFPDPIKGDTAVGLAAPHPAKRYTGSTWTDVGNWQGPQGPKGADGAAGTVAVQNAGTAVATASTLNFVGEGVTATDAGAGKVDVTVPKPNLADVQGYTYNPDGTIATTVLVTDATKLVFDGAGVTATDAGSGIIQLNIPKAESGGGGGGGGTATAKVAVGQWKRGNYYIVGPEATSTLSHYQQFTPFVVDEAMTFDRVQVHCIEASGATGTIRIGIYDSPHDGGTLIQDFGLLSVSGGFNGEAAISITLQPGLYWLSSVSRHKFGNIKADYGQMFGIPNGKGGTPKATHILGGQPAPADPLPATLSGIGYYTGSTEILWIVRLKRSA